MLESPKAKVVIVALLLKKIKEEYKERERDVDCWPWQL